MSSKINKILSFFNIHKIVLDYNFFDHIQGYGFILRKETNTAKLFYKPDTAIKLFADTNKKEVHVFENKHLIIKLNFIPTTPIFTDILLTKSIEKL